ncbi:MAG TPA: phospholipase D-like domain-containing protein [Gemmatimonadaceae bacterium]|nr:phospholipase D-like domain-containing protein [Gemmatimonadaceae bacterium]
MDILIKGVVAALLLASFILAVIGLQSLTRGTTIARLKTPGDGDGPPGPRDPLFCESLALLTKTAILPGHRVELFGCGDETYPRLWEDLRSAERSITLQMYYCQPGRMADEFKDILLERAKAGVKVLFLRDAFGSGQLKEEYVEEMKRGGIEVATFRPTRWYQLFKVYHRSHIRVAVIDGMVGYTGGYGIDDKWYGDGKHKDQWRDTTTRFTGPSVLQLQATFAAGWAEATGTLLAGDLFFPPDGMDTHDGNVSAGLLHASPSVGSTSAERYYALAIGSAKRRLWISNSYFVPSENFCELLVGAVQRGVDVRILTCNEDGDVKSTYHAGRAAYGSLLARGVRIFEYQPAMMHAKSIVADSRFVSAGTVNFDNRSMSFNDETTLLAVDDELGGRMERMFEEDLRHSKEITAEAHAARPLKEKLLDYGASLLARVL